MGQVTAKWVKSHTLSKLSNHFDTINLITTEPDNYLLVRLHMFPSPAANPTMTTTCRREASACSRRHTNWASVTTNISPDPHPKQYIYLWLHKEGDVWRVSLCLLPVCFPRNWRIAHNLKETQNRCFVESRRSCGFVAVCVEALPLH